MNQDSGHSMLRCRDVEDEVLREIRRGDQGGLCESFLEGFKCSFYLFIPDKGYVGMEQAQETVNGCGVIRNEASKKIGSPLQTLELPERSRRGKV